MNTTRREFVHGAVCLAAVGALPAFGCAIAPSIRARVADSALRVALADWPEAESVVVARREDRKSPVLLIRRAGRYEALSSICSHQGCIVRPENARFVCPCHGSTFAMDGSVERGPAGEDLARFETRLDGEDLVILLPRGAQ